MKKLSAYVNEIDESVINEYRTKKTEDVDLKDVQGKPADNFGSSKIDWSIDEPTDDDAADTIDLNSPDNTESMEDLIDKFDAEEVFM